MAVFALTRAREPGAPPSELLVVLRPEIVAELPGALDDPVAPLDAVDGEEAAGLLRRGLQQVQGLLFELGLLVEELLLQEPKLTLIRLQTLDAKPLLDADGMLQSADLMAAALHRHDFAIEFAGDYMATLRYLQALEALPWRFFWDSVSYEVEDYPRSLVRLRLHTLSLSEDWIGV